jgi:hypothetical protein
MILLPLKEKMPAQPKVPGDRPGSWDADLPDSHDSSVPGPVLGSAASRLLLAPDAYRVLQCARHLNQSPGRL